jgi:hypothetical protein
MTVTALVAAMAAAKVTPVARRQIFINRPVALPAG